MEKIIHNLIVARVIISKQFQLTNLIISMPTATITVNNTCIDVYRSYGAYFDTDTFPYTKLFCKFTVDRSLLAHELHLMIRPKRGRTSASLVPAVVQVSSSAPAPQPPPPSLIAHCKKLGVYNQQYDVFFGRVVWDINKLLKGIDYGEIEYCVHLDMHPINWRQRLK